jgi:hypothetical protein
MKPYCFTQPPTPKILRRSSVQLDNAALVPGNLLPYKSQYQQLANGLPKGDILIVLSTEVQRRQAFEKTAAQLKNKGRRITTIRGTVPPGVEP